MKNDYEYTAYMEGVIRNITEKISCCREEAEDKWAEVCRMKGTSGYVHRKKELTDMLTSCGISCGHAETDDEWQACIAQVPTMMERDDALFAMMHDVYQEFPTAGNYMERLVRRLGDPAFRQDSVRLAIVKQFLQETEWQTEPVLQWAKQQYGLSAAAGTEELRKNVVAVLGEEVFSLLQAELTAAEWAEVFLSKMDSGILAQVQAEEGEALQMLLQGTGYDTKWTFAEKLQFLQKQTPAVAEAEAKAFLEQAEKAMYQLFRGKSKTDAKPKEQYQQRKKDIVKRKRSKLGAYGLLQLADDLAMGRFRVQNDTKKALYLFAAAFSMTVAEADACDPLTDIEKNLFFDYYQDSLLKYISGDYRLYASIYEEPSGEGINYKNFAETIWLYALSRGELNAAEKISLAEELTAVCVKEAGRRKTVPAEQNLPITEIYREFFFGDILSMEQEELVTYILENYEIPAGITADHAMQAASEQVTAAYTYEKLLQELEDMYEEQKISMETMNWVEMRDYPAICREDGDFHRLLEKMNEMLHIRAVRRDVYEKQDVDDRQMKSAVADLFAEHGTVSRLDLIAACFYRYSLSEQGEGLSLPELIEDFRAETDPLLEQCRYQKISVKNLFDMFVLFMLYRISL